MGLLLEFLKACLLFVIIDMLWLRFVTADFNAAQLANLGRFRDGSFDVWPLPAALSYLMMALALFAFVGPRVKGRRGLWPRAAWGGLMGFLVYGIFDATNAASIRGYPLPFALVDVAWGTVLFALVSALTFAPAAK